MHIISIIEMKFSERLNVLMNEKQISSLVLSKIIHIDDTTISRWRKGTIIPTIDKVDILCDFFGVTSDFLLGRED